MTFVDRNQTRLAQIILTWVVVALLGGIVLGVVLILALDQREDTDAPQPKIQWVEYDVQHELGFGSDGLVRWRERERQPIIPRPRPKPDGQPLGEPAGDPASAIPNISVGRIA